VPLHPYSDLLVSSIPELRTGWLDGLAQRPSEPELGVAGLLSRADCCPFVGRCPVRQPGLCDVAPPPLRRLSKGSDILCHRDEGELVEMGVVGQAQPRYFDASNRAGKG
jgi:peptide/nickel transport system ATP-binding protein